MSICVRCGSKRNIHRHHITYTPCKISLLCKNCHKGITSLNTRASRIDQNPLVNLERENLYNYFLNNRWKGKVPEEIVKGILDTSIIASKPTKFRVPGGVKIYNGN